MTQLTIPVNNGDHIAGHPQAPLELVEYGDYECPYCGNAYPIVKDIQERLGEELKFVFRNFPLRRIHPNAWMASLATEAAGLQTKFWEMHDMIFENQKILNNDIFLHFAHKLGLDADRFKRDIQKQHVLDKVERDFESGIRSGVNRTPTFFINGNKFEGSYNRDELFQELERQLANKIFPVPHSQE